MNSFRAPKMTGEELSAHLIGAIATKWEATGLRMEDLAATMIVAGIQIMLTRSDPGEFQARLTSTLSDIVAERASLTSNGVAGLAAELGAASPRSGVRH